MPFRLALLALMFLSGCESSSAPQPQPTAASTPPIPTVGEPPLATASRPAVADGGLNGKSAEDAFIAAYRQAHKNKDVEGLLALYCWDGVPDATKAILRIHVRNELVPPGVESIEIVPSTDFPEVTVKIGKTIKANLKPVAKCKVVFKPVEGGSDKRALTNLTYNLGLKDGRYLIVMGVKE